MNRTFQQVLTSAVAELERTGFDNEKRLDYWTAALRRAAINSLPSEEHLVDSLRRGLTMIYRRLVDRGGILKFHKEADKFTLQKLAPRLRAELERRIMASAQLIRLNRTNAIETTLRRMAGWATSIPEGGSDAVQTRIVKEQISKPLSQLNYKERRVIIDQGHKLTASISEVIARDGQAIAVRWHSHWRQAGYDYREDHRERDDHVYLLRDSWARDKGLVKPGADGYYDDITHVGEEINCRCYAEWLYSIRSLPAEMLTVKGCNALEEARRKVAAMRSGETRAGA